MPREARKISYSGFYHVMIRGVNKEIIFKDDRDRRNFLHLLKYYKIKLNCMIHAYCLMDNHVHILIEDNNNKLGELMRNVTSVYAGEFNKKYRRIGHLFQERFKSQNVENDYYLLRLVRYIHRNPEKAGICNTEDYIWSSYKEILYGERIVERKFILKKYDKDINKAIRMFSENLLNDKEDCIDNVYFKNKITTEDKKEFIKYIIKIEDIGIIKTKTKKEIREIIKKIKETKKLTASDISEITGISKNIIYKTNG